MPSRRLRWPLLLAALTITSPSPTGQHQLVIDPPRGLPTNPEATA